MKTYEITDECFEGAFQDQSYRQVAKAIAFLDKHAEAQPSLADLSEHLSLSPSHAQRLFRRWAGISPKQFVRAVTYRRARDFLQNQMSVLDAAHHVGLSGPSRLHDLSIRFEALTPGEIARGGAGTVLSYGFHPSPFGLALFVVTERGLSALGFADESKASRQAALADMKARWPAAQFVANAAATALYADKIFKAKRGKLILAPLGTEFQIQVWQALLRIAPGRVITYSGLADHVNVPRAVRAVASAVGRNPISYIIPCHRVLRKSGALGGYHWGLMRKKAMLTFESAQCASE